MKPLKNRARLVPALLTLPLATAALSACGTDSPEAGSDPARGDAATVRTEASEVSHLAPRALVADTAGRLTLIDTESGTEVGAGQASGFVRLSDAGDGRHVVVADGDRFRFFDTGVHAEQHGDHDHLYAAPGKLLEVERAAKKAGHAVQHGEWTALFSDGTGRIDLVRTAELTSPDAAVETVETSGEHHGVAVRLADGSIATTWSNGEERNGLRLLKDGTTVAATDDCAGVHGEAVAAPDAAGEVLVFGCTDGPVVLRGGEFHKVDVPHDYLRTGNLAGHPEHPVVLTDHKSDPDADLERPTKVGLLDTRTDTLREVELGSSYWFRSLGRDADGDAVVLTYDGTLRVLDPETGEQTSRVPAIGEWSENEDWQQPGPVLEVVDGIAYVADANAAELVVVDLAAGKVTARHPLPEDGVELVVTPGSPEHHPHGDHDH